MLLRWWVGREGRREEGGGDFTHSVPPSPPSPSLHFVSPPQGGKKGLINKGAGGREGGKRKREGGRGIFYIIYVYIYLYIYIYNIYR
jgi:hypothetical protein